jgi:hypothetical protein
MAAVCAKCGAELHPGSESCSVCGTPVAPGVATQPPLTKKKSHMVRKIVLGLVAVVVVVFVGLLVIGMIVNQRNLQNQAAQNSQGTTPAATATPAITANDLGLPLYPGATLDSGGAQRTVTSSAVVVQATLWTSDPVSSVTAYYQSAMGSQVTVMGLGDETILSAGGGNNTVTMMIDSESGKTKMLTIHTVTNGN